MANSEEDSTLQIGCVILIHAKKESFVQIIAIFQVFTSNRYLIIIIIITYDPGSDFIALKIQNN